MKAALNGIRVADLSHVLAGPFCTLILADFGAEVIKIEPPAGDDARSFGPFIREKTGKGRQSGYFISINRNKKSLCLDLKTPGGKEIFKRLLKLSDVVVENYRPDTMKRLGFPYETLKEINPAVIYCSISGFGHETPADYAGKPAYDMVAQAYSGLMSITGPEGGPPCRVGTSVGDIVSGHQAATAILSALIYRQQTGRGQYIDMSMLDGLVYILENAISRYTVTGEVPSPLGTAHPSITPFQAFKTRDSWIIIPIGNDRLWHDLCQALDRPDLLQDSRFATNNLRNKNKKVLVPQLENVLAGKSTAEWAEILSRFGLPYSPLHSIDQVVKDPVVNHRKMMVELDQTNIGNIKTIGTPFKLSETPGTVHSPAPLLGEHTDEIMIDLLGYTEEQLGRLRTKGVVK